MFFAFTAVNTTQQVNPFNLINEKALAGWDTSPSSGTVEPFLFSNMIRLCYWDPSVGIQLDNPTR